MRPIDKTTPMKPMTAPATAPFSANIGRAPKAALFEVLSAPLAEPERDAVAPEPEPEPLAEDEPVAVALGEIEAKNDAADA